MAINQAPPPPQPAPVPAQVQTVSAAHAQRLASPEQSVINDVNAGKYGKGFTAGMPNAAQQKTQNAMNAAQNAGSVAKGIGDARNQRNINQENNSPIRKGPGYADHPPNKSGNKAIEAMKAKSANSPPPATPADQNKGIAAHAQRLASPGQSVINDVNSGKYGKDFTAGMQNSTQIKSPSVQSEAPQTGSSTNKGISSFKNKLSGQSSSTSKSSSNGETKGGQKR